MTRIAFALFALAMGGAALTIVATAGGLPPVVASHFGAGGRASGWMAREAYLGLMLALTILLPLAIVAALSWLPRIAPGAVNLPNRAHWLAPARRRETLDALAVFACAFGGVLAGFLAGVHLLVVAAHAGPSPRLDETLFLALLGAFGVATALWVAALLRRFRA
jgi:hypothetical protein